MESSIAIEDRIKQILRDQKQLIGTLAQAETRHAELKAYLERQYTSIRIRRQQAKFAMSLGVSRRRACALVGISRACLETAPAPSASESSIKEEMKRLHKIHPEYGIRRIRGLLSAQGFLVSKYRCEKLWQEIMTRDIAKNPPLAKDIDETSMLNISMTSLAAYFHGLATSA